MLHFTRPVETEGQLPEPFTPRDFLNKDSITSRAEKIYKTHPNLVARIPSEEGPLVVKWFGWRHPVHFVLSPTFTSRAFASYHMANALKGTSARTPEPLYVYTHRHGGFIKENFFITRAIHPHTPLRPLLISGAPEDLLKAAIQDLARSIARMHTRRILHRDLTTANFLVNETGEVFIIDLNRARQVTSLSTHQRLKDLARLTFKSNDGALENLLSTLFFNSYQKESGVRLNLLEPYHQYRKKLLWKRELKKRLRRLTGRQ